MVYNRGTSFYVSSSVVEPRLYLIIQVCRSANLQSDAISEEFKSPLVHQLNGGMGESGLNQQIANLSSALIVDRRFESFCLRHKTHTANFIGID